MSRHRLTPRKRKFADALVAGMTATDAARTAGYAHPEVKSAQLLAKGKDGKYKDKSLESYLRTQAEAAPAPAPPGREVAGATASSEGAPIGDADEVIRELFAILRNVDEPGGTRIRAAETLLKALGKDRPDEVREKDLEGAVAAVRRMLGRD